MPFAYATPDLDAVPDRFASLGSRLRENDEESSDCLWHAPARAIIGRNVRCSQYMTLGHTAAQERVWSLEGPLYQHRG